MPKNTVPRSGRASAPKKPKNKPAAKPKTKSAAKPVQKPDAKPAESFCKFPDWVDFQPLADYRLIAWESDESSVEVLLTSQEYGILKDHLARLRGFTVPTEAANA